MVCVPMIPRLQIGNDKLGYSKETGSNSIQDKYKRTKHDSSLTNQMNGLIYLIQVKKDDLINA